MVRKKKNKLLRVTTHLFEADVDTLRRLAEANGSGWQIELRQLVRKARGAPRQVMLLKEQR